jgi:8-oxo-dGTP diphosphatase
VAAEPGTSRGAPGAAAPHPEVRVVAGALFDAERRVLIAQRPAGKHMAGRWELPGGKLDPGETPIEGLRRELAEELGVELRDARPLIRLRHDYADRRVCLDVWRVTDFDGVPRGLDGQALAWVALDDLPGRDILEADLPIITALRLPNLACMATGVAGLEAAVRQARESRTLLWRPSVAGAAEESARQAVRSARAAGHRVLVVGEEVAAVTIAAFTGADGVALEWSGEELAVDPRGVFLVGVVGQSPRIALRAARAGAQFVVLVPSEGPLPGAELAQLCEAAGVPVLSGCYAGPECLVEVRASGAHGCVVGVAPGGEVEAS